MKGHPHPDVGGGKTLLVLSSFITGEVNEEWNAGGEAVSAGAPYRPLLTSHSPSDVHRSEEDGPFKPLTKMDKPRIQGLQSAIVVGPKGEDIFVDEHGRVRLQFPWDREAKGDESGSTWVRVAQQWAGPGFGMITHPRVGQEVLVGFFGGRSRPSDGRRPDVRHDLPHSLPHSRAQDSHDNEEQLEERGQ